MKTTKSFKSKQRDRSKHSRKKYKNKARIGGGKGGQRWDDYGDYSTALDRGDPNYDSAEEEVAPAMLFTKVEITLRQYKEAIKTIIKEYFTSEDSLEVATCLDELEADHFHWEFVKRAMTMAFDKRPRERELISRLFSNLYFNTLSKEQFQRGFLRVFEQIDDLVIDIPDVHIYLAQFLARAVADEILPPVFLKNKDASHLCKDVIMRAQRILKRGLSRAERVWGPVELKEIKAAIKTLVEEFLLGGGAREAARSLLELRAARYHHEFVKRAVVLSMDRKITQQESVSDLFHFLYKHELVSDTQFRIGFERLFEALPDLKLDVPAAEGLFKAFVTRGKEDGYLAPNFIYQDLTAKDLQNMADFKAPVPRTQSKADVLENLEMMNAVAPDSEEEDDDPELVEPGMSYEDHLNMQEFVNNLPSPQVPKTASPKNPDYAMMQELEADKDTDSEEEAQQQFLQQVAKYGRDLVRNGLE